MFLYFHFFIKEIVINKIPRKIKNKDSWLFSKKTIPVYILTGAGGTGIFKYLHNSKISSFSAKNKSFGKALLDKGLVPVEKKTGVSFDAHLLFQNIFPYGTSGSISHPQNYLFDGSPEISFRKEQVSSTKVNNKKVSIFREPAGTQIEQIKPARKLYIRLYKFRRN